MSHARATGPSGISDEEPYIYKKGPAFGMPGVLVDGMDVRKVRCKLRKLRMPANSAVKDMRAAAAHLHTNT